MPAASGRLKRKSPYDDVVGKMVDIPGVVFGVPLPDVFYTGQVMKRDHSHAGHHTRQPCCCPTCAYGCALSEDAPRSKQDPVSQLPPRAELAQCSGLVCSCFEIHLTSSKASARLQQLAHLAA